ncbi:Skp1 family, dimerization domain-containing protein [Blastocladiella britannica]|nr:Skp1 family, dimerization domain-containing protein [Blastocladiella britannica]
MADTVALLGSDGLEVQVARKVAERSVLIKNFLGDMVDATRPVQIPIPKATAAVLTKVFEYCDHHKDDPVVPEEENAPETRKSSANIDPWDLEFMNIDQLMLYELITAANFLDIKPLLDLCCKVLANMIKGKSVEELRSLFGIVNDYTPEEEEEVRKENAWAEEC